ncbi:MAG: type VI secretion system protein TssA [Pseudorhodobacter sp.]|nr:type VI secretion system protein TssA [Pseudorhodobacter sp.]
MDLDALLSPRGGDEPSGENLEYDFDFMQLQIAAQPGEERQAGKEIIAASDPDFKDVEQKALAILERAHDLRAAVILASAVLQTKGLKGFAEATAYIRGCLEQHWDTCHPQLDADDDNDPTMRINAIKGLGGSDTVLTSLRKTALTNSRTFGRLTLRDVQIAFGEMPPPEGQDPQYDRTSVAAAFADTGEEALGETLAAIRSALADVKAIEAVFSDRTPGYGPDLDDLRKMLQQLARHVGDNVSAPDAAGDAEDDEAESTPAAGGFGSGPARRGGGLPGSVETAQDARVAIDRVIEYFRRYEPSSPVPIILERAKRLVGADFMAIMKDMAPGGLDSVRMIGGLEDDDD